MDKKLTLNELQAALRQLKAKKLPGPDAITNEILSHLGNKATCKLLEIFNHSWATGALPHTWREATMIPILKKGKDPQTGSQLPPRKPHQLCWENYVESWQPTPQVVPVDQRPFGTRTSWILAVPCDWRSDHILVTGNRICVPGKEGHQCCLDWSTARIRQDVDWWAHRQADEERSCQHHAQIQSYLFNRRARVSLDQLSSRKILLCQGVPQGVVISPTLFLVFINDLVSELPSGGKAALYADDLVLLCKEEHASTANYRIQQAIDQLTAWTEDWCVTVNKDKSSTTLFHQSSKLAPSRLVHILWKKKTKPINLV